MKIKSLSIAILLFAAMQAFADGQGDDIFLGPAGNDIDLGLSGGVNVTGNAANNVITGNDGNNNLDGQAGNDTISGKGGNDFLVGGLGQDTVTGGSGSDVFRLNAPAGGANMDTLTDFNPVEDVIQLENAVYSQLPAGVIPSGYLRIGDSPTDANDYLIYNPSTGILSYDADAAGGAAKVWIAQLPTGLTVTAGNFIGI